MKQTDNNPGQTPTLIPVLSSGQPITDIEKEQARQDVDADQTMRILQSRQAKAMVKAAKSRLGQ